MSAALLAQSTQLAQPNAQDDGDALALRYGAEVSLRGARGLGLSVAPVREADDVVFEAAVGGLNLGAADERFVVCNAMVRDDKGPVRYGDVVGLRSRLARGRCPAARRGLRRRGRGAGLPARSPAGRREGCCPRRTRPAAARRRRRRGDVVRSGDSVNSARSARASVPWARRRGWGRSGERGGADGLGRQAWRLAAAASLSRWLDDRPYLSARRRGEPRGRGRGRGRRGRF